MAIASTPDVKGQPAPSPSPGALPKPVVRAYNVSIGYLRAFITLLVLAHHSVLAYHPYAPPPPPMLDGPNRWWQAFPVVDPQRWTGSLLFASFNDIFFMSLLFFLSGLFLWNSLRRKGSGRFWLDRARRLGLPFLVAAALVAPLAYFPTYLQIGGSGLRGFWRQWRGLGNWPAGPAWFVWILLLFDSIAAALFLLLPRWGDALGRLAGSAGRRPLVFFALLMALSGAAYMPLAAAFTPLRWSSLGPFTFQTSRLLQYGVYFFLGAGVGAYGLERSLLASGSKLARRWAWWSVWALLAFGLAALTVHTGSRAWGVAADFTFVLSCAASSFAFLALFVRFAGKRSRAFDSLTRNAYGMYLIHYPVVSWLQFALLRSSLPAAVKATLVFAGTALVSWVATAALRRIPAIARVI